ncbi:MAG: zf-HC2 domain-containing protein [Anaerolineae bacterium]|nr:zf-HC2 domain-containing protein [Anaerolineae bacterium]
MKCVEVQQLLVAYLSGEVNESEAALIRFHLEHCADCSANLAALSGVRDRLGTHLNARLSQAHVPEHAWKRISAKIGEMNMNENQPSMRRAGSLRAAAIALLALIAVMGIILAAVPPARAAVEGLILTLFEGETDSGLPVIAASEFQPLYPAGVPDRILCSASFGITSPEPTETYLELRFFNELEFAVLYENLEMANDPLPDGEPLDVNGHPAVLFRDLSGTVALMSGQPQEGRTPTQGGGGGGGGCQGSEPIVPPERLDYTGALRLVWTQDGMRFDLLSNLPYEELLALAASLEPAQPAQP